MIRKIRLLGILLTFFLNVKAQNSRIVSRQAFDLAQYDTLMQRLTEPKGGQWVYKNEYQYLKKVTIKYNLVKYRGCLEA